MVCRRSERLNVRSPSPEVEYRGRGRGRGRGAASPAPRLEREVEQPAPGEPALEELHRRARSPQLGDNDAPPPPPPSLSEVMDRQTRLLEALADGILRRPGGGPPNDFQRKLEGFLKLRPPTFDCADDDPIAAEDWLREIEKKLDLTTCTDEECVGVAAHQLTGAARAWWDSYSDTHENPGGITWAEFTEAFREQHVPEGVMDAKVEEFRNISQGTQKVQEYATRFTRTMRYAPDESNTEKKKMYFFKKGLSTRLKVALSGHTCYTLREMINKALEMERDRLEADAQYKEKKRRSESSSRGPAPQRPRAHVPPPSRPRSAQGAAPAPSRGGGTHTGNYHRPLRAAPCRVPARGRPLHPPPLAVCLSLASTVVSQATRRPTALRRLLHHLPRLRPGRHLLRVHSASQLWEPPAAVSPT
uniref:Retrotransposon gag domain-containing protein n=1 Tax=Sorghum bicolor TaxID=4558 RepID=Q9XE67_SORBI|nr:hypothetical protein [Sorghum bicolor]